MKILFKIFSKLFRGKNEENKKQTITSKVSVIIVPKSVKSPWKNNREEYQEILEQHRIDRLYHFTDRSNVDSIKSNGGLFSWHYCDQHNIQIARPGGNQLSRNLDSMKNLQNYVRLSFVKDHPMMFIASKEGRITQPVILEIDPEVVFLNNTLYAPKNAAKNGTIATGSIEMLKSINFDILKKRYFDLEESLKPYYQAEVLVLEQIPIKYITNINNF